MLPIPVPISRIVSERNPARVNAHGSDMELQNFKAMMTVGEIPGATGNT
jgi:hypothetical protein